MKIKVTKVDLIEAAIEFNRNNGACWTVPCGVCRALTHTDGGASCPNVLTRYSCAADYIAKHRKKVMEVCL